MFCATFIFQTRSRAYLKNHSYNLHAPICGIFCFHSVAVARYAALIQAKSSTSQAQPSENERILICGLGASVGYERVERVFNTPRLKSQIRILLVCIPSSRQLKKYKIFVLPGVYRATFLCRQSLLFMKFHWC